MSTLGLSSTNLAPGAVVQIETSSLPGGVLALQAASSSKHNVQLTDALTDAGIGVGATATGGAMGVSRTAGTSLVLVGETTSSNAKTDKVAFAISLPSTYQAGSAVSVDANCVAAGTGTITGASTTLTLAAYSEVNGVETSLTVTGGSQQIPITNTDLIFSIAATGLATGTRIMLEFTMLVTTSSGANTGTINNVSYTA